MKICIVTCLNERPGVSNILFNCAERLGLPVIVCVTTEADRIFAISRGVKNPVVCENVPGKKWNTALEYAYECGFDYFLIMGDDDAISDHGMLLLGDAVRSGQDYVGFKSNCFYDLRSGEAMSHVYPYKCDKLIGAGRMISRKSIYTTAFRTRVTINREFGNFQRGTEVMLPPPTAEYMAHIGYISLKSQPEFTGLWNPKLRQGLDKDSEIRLVMNGFIPRAVDDDRIHVTDFKSEVNIWTYSILKADQKQKCKPCQKDAALWFLSPEERNYVESLRG